MTDLTFPQIQFGARRSPQQKGGIFLKALKSSLSYESLAVSHGRISNISWKIFFLKSDFLKELPKPTNNCLANTTLMLHVILYRISYTLEIP